MFGCWKFRVGYKGRVPWNVDGSVATSSRHSSVTNVRCGAQRLTRDGTLLRVVE